MGSFNQGGNYQGGNYNRRNAGNYANQANSGGFGGNNYQGGGFQGQPNAGAGAGPNGQTVILQDGDRIVSKPQHHPFCRAVFFIFNTLTLIRNIISNLIFILALILLFALVSAFLSLGESFKDWTNGNLQQYESLVPDAEVLCIDLKGAITEIPFSNSGFDSLQREIEFSLYGRQFHELLAVEKALELVHHDPQIKKVLIKLDGMQDVSLSVAERIGQAMEYAKAKNTSNPHEVIVTGTVFTQTSYVIAAHADRVILDPLGEIDFKGLSLSSLFFKDLLEKANITPYVFRAGHFKSAVEPFILNNMSYDVKKEYEAIAYKSWSLYKDLILIRDKIKNKDVLPDAATYISWLNRFKGDRASLQLAEGFVDEVVPLESFYRSLSQEVVADGDDPNRPALITYQDYLMRYFVNTQGAGAPVGSLSNIPVPTKSAASLDVADVTKLPQQAVTQSAVAASSLLQSATQEQINMRLKEFYNSTAKLIPQGDQRIEVIYGVGEITDFKENANDFTPDNIVPLLDRARLNDNVLGVILYLNSPGGSVNGSEKIRRAVEELQDSGKPVFVSMNGTAASGAYWIACQADQIFATTTTITGSIGVFGISFGAHELLNKFGAYQDGVYTNELAQPAIGKVMPNSQQVKLNFQVENTYKNFISLVAANRELDVLAYPRYAEGQIFLADNAQELGLIDHVGSLQDTIEAMQITLMDNPKLKLKNKVKVVHVSPSVDVELSGIESILFGLSAKYLPEQITSSLIELKKQSKLLKGARNDQAILAISPIGEPKL